MVHFIDSNHNVTRMQQEEKQPCLAKIRVGQILRQACLVVYAENCNGGGFIQWHMVIIFLWCAVFAMSQFDVIFMFPNQRFGEAC